MQGLDPFIVQTCRKGYPRSFQEETIINEDGYPTYRRRDMGQAYTMSIRRAGADVTALIDNGRVVPYSPYLATLQGSYQCGGLWVCQSGQVH